MKNFIKELLKKFSSWLIFWLWIIVAIIWVLAFQAPTGWDTSPSTSWFTSTTSYVATQLTSILNSLTTQSGTLTTIKAKTDTIGIWWITALSPRAGSTTFANAAIYCRDLSSTAEYVIDWSNTSTTYTDWKLPSHEELATFVWIPSETTYLWTSTPTYISGLYYTTLRLTEGIISTWQANVTSQPVRCVR